LGFGADYRQEVGIKAFTSMEQADPILFLCSDAAASITGITLLSDAGWFSSANHRVVSPVRPSSPTRFSIDEPSIGSVKRALPA
jgi:hypothetical protein